MHNSPQSYNNSNLPMTKEELHQELLKDSREFCCYCGTERYRLGCCGEVHYVTYADMSKDEQEDMLEYEFERENSNA